MIPRLGEKAVDDLAMYIGQPKISTLKLKRQFRVVDAEKVEQGVPPFV